MSKEINIAWRKLVPTPGKARSSWAAVMFSCGLIFAACSAGAWSSDPASAGKARTGVLETSAGSYEFTPTTCAIHEEDGADDIEIAGPGKAPDGEDLYFEMSSIGNEMRIDLGVNRPFADSDRNIRAGQFASKAFTVEVSDGIVSVTDLALIDERGRPVDFDASLRIDCVT